MPPIGRIAISSLLAVSIATRVVLGAGGAFTGTRHLPSSYGVSSEPSNPVIDVVDNPAETVEQYDPGVIRLPNGQTWVYVKGQSRIYAWMATDGVNFTLQNGGSAVIAPGASGHWDSLYTLEAVVLLDEPNSLIHLW